MERLYRGSRDVRDLKGVQLCAVGPSARDRLLRYGVSIDLVPPDFRAEGVVEALDRVSTPLAGNALPAAARRRRPRTPGRGAARRRRRGHRRHGVSHAAGRPRSRSRSRPLPDAARSRNRRRDLHQRGERPQLRAHLRRGAGRRPAPADRRRRLRPRHRRSRRPPGHPGIDHARRYTARRAGQAIADHYRR